MATGKPLSPAERRQWVRAGWGYCPYCGSDQLDGGPYEGDANYVTTEVQCLDCRRRWREGYTLRWMEDLT